jgi:hypothetical protein
MFGEPIISVARPVLDVEGRLLRKPREERLNSAELQWLLYYCRKPLQSQPREPKLYVPIDQCGFYHE